MNKLPLVIFLLLSLIMNSCTATKVAEQLIVEPVAMNICDNDLIAALDRRKPLPKPKHLIVIDPGHGGEDFGTQSPFKPIVQEKNLNLIAAQFLQSYLQQMGYQTAMTRKNDSFLSLEGRAKFANNLQPALFVSVHFNSAPAASAHGIEVFYYLSEVNKERSERSKLLAEKILHRVISNTDAKSRGVKHGDLSVIRNTNIPAVLVEGGFLTNEAEYQKLKDTAYIKKLTWGIAQGIQEFVSRR